jgi:LacI family repressor for deo operon, udp, cdd, tsx, nupC, and nupG
MDIYILIRYNYIIMSKKVSTLKDVARQVGCSTAVVSTVLNGARGNTGVSEKLRKEVLTVAKNLDYRPNFSARSLRIRESIGPAFLLINDIDKEGKFSPYWGQIISGAEHGVDEQDKNLVVIGEKETETDSALERRSLRYLHEGRIGGLIVPSYMSHLNIGHFQDSDGPIVWILGGPEESAHPRVNMDPAPGIFEAVSHLNDLKHTEITWLCADSDDDSIMNPRKEAFHNACKKYNITPTVKNMYDKIAWKTSELYNDNSEEITRASIAAADELLSANPPSAIICSQEIIAVGVYYSALRKGLNIPEDLSVIGFDDFHAENMYPQLTSITHNLFGIGKRAAEIALECERDSDAMESYRGKTELVPSYLIVRNSTEKKK